MARINKTESGVEAAAVPALPAKGSTMVDASERVLGGGVDDKGQLGSRITPHVL